MASESKGTEVALNGKLEQIMNVQKYSTYMTDAFNVRTYKPTLYDPFLFPSNLVNPRSEVGGTTSDWAIEDHDISALSANEEFRQLYPQTLAMFFATMGYNIFDGIQSRDLDITNYSPERVARCLYSMKCFGLVSEYRNGIKFLIENDLYEAFLTNPKAHYCLYDHSELMTKECKDIKFSTDGFAIYEAKKDDFLTQETVNERGRLKDEHTRGSNYTCGRQGSGYYSDDFIINYMIVSAALNANPQFQGLEVKLETHASGASYDVAGSGGDEYIAEGGGLGDGSGAEYAAGGGGFGAGSDDVNLDVTTGGTRDALPAEDAPSTSPSCCSLDCCTSLDCSNCCDGGGGDCGNCL
jgi:hypothetical protein